MNKAKGFTLIELPVVRKCKRRAFTLIELLVVVSIIALMVAILVPATQHAREEAKRSVCGGNLHTIDQAAYLYSENYYEKYPLGWPHDEDPQHPGQWTQYGSGAVPNDNRITPQDSFAQLVHLGLLVTGSLICPTVSGEPAADEWELVAAGAPPGEPRWPAADNFIHYAYQDPGQSGSTYEASPDTELGWPMFGDRGKRAWNLEHTAYVLTGQASANHDKRPGCQNILGGAHGVKREYTETRDNPATTEYDERGCCMAGYVNGRRPDNIYQNNSGLDTWLLDHDGHIP